VRPAERTQPRLADLTAALGLAGVGLYATNLAAGDGLGQAWFVAFLTAYAVGISRLLSEWRDG